MNLLRRTVLTALSMAIPLFSMAQSTCRGLPDYADLQGSCVRCTYGKADDPALHIGIAPTRHTIISQQGFDPNTGNQLALIPEGFLKSVRLGNQQVGAESESIRYTFEVDPLNALISLRFAVVFEDPAHTFENQPRFVVRILDAQGRLVEPCAQYDVYSGEELPGFETFMANGIPVRWRPWTTMGLNLVNYVGQTIQVEFVTYDCFHTGHFGYAYFVMEQGATTLKLDACQGDLVTLSAPEGYSSYLWSHGDTQAQTQLAVHNPPLRTSCLIQTATGCQFTLNAIIGRTGADWYSDTTIFDTICQGQEYVTQGFDLPAQWDIGDWMHTVTYMDLNLCKGAFRKFLRLKVLQTHFPVLADLCAGQSYVEHGFRYMRPSPGLYTDTMHYVGRTGCDSVICLTLRVSPSFDMPLAIDGPRKPCMLQTQNYGLSNAFGLGNYRWEMPEGYYIIRGQTTPNIEIKITDHAKPQDTIRLHLSNGCGTGTLKALIEPMPAYFETFLDSACTDTPYEAYDFKIPPKDSFGDYVFVNRLQSSCGCDSVRTLYLALFPKPKAQILTDQEVLCASDKATLTLSIEGVKPKGRKVFVGDVLCTDGSTMSLADYQADASKVAEGVVVFVDRTGYHGWAAGLNNIPGKPMCTRNPYVDIPDLSNYDSYHGREALADTNGYMNTLLWRAAGTASQYPMPWTVDFNNGWYIPAIGQLSFFLTRSPLLNPILEALGGTQVPSHLNTPLTTTMYGWSLASSTEQTDQYYWVMGFNFGTRQGRKIESINVRPFKSF